MAQIKLKYYTRVSEQSLISERIRTCSKNLWPVKTILPEVKVLTVKPCQPSHPHFGSRGKVLLRTSAEQKDMIPHRTLHFLRSVTLLRLQLIQQHSQPWAEKATTWYIWVVFSEEFAVFEHANTNIFIMLYSRQRRRRSNNDILILDMKDGNRWFLRNQRYQCSRE